ncbi:hypothetical protein HPB47_018898, partial [Ixodes persulcatus]
METDERSGQWELETPARLSRPAVLAMLAVAAFLRYTTDGGTGCEKPVESNPDNNMSHARWMVLSDRRLDVKQAPPSGRSRAGPISEEGKEENKKEARRQGSLACGGYTTDVMPPPTLLISLHVGLVSTALGSLKFKRTAIAFAEDNGNHSAAAGFGVDRACIRWRKQRGQIMKGAPTRKKFTGLHKGRHPQMEEEVCEFVRSERCRGFAVTADAIQMKALEIATGMQIPRTVFRASRGWVE